MIFARTTFMNFKRQSKSAWHYFTQQFCVYLVRRDSAAAVRLYHIHIIWLD